MKKWNWIKQVLVAVLICGLMPFSVQGEEITCEQRAALKKRIDRQLSDAMIFKAGVNHAFVGTRRQIDPLDTEVKPFMEEDTLLVPARFTGEAMGAQVEWYEKTQSIYLKTAFSILQVNIGEKKYEVNGESHPMDTAAALKDDHVYLPVTAVAQAFSKKLSMFDDMAVLDSREVAFAPEEPYDACVEAVADKLYYDRPTGEKVIADLKAKNPQNAHPRILADRDKIESIKALAKKGGRFGGWVEKLISSAEGDLEKEPVKYVKPDGFRLLETSRSVLGMAQTLGMAYQLTGDTKYAERMWKELETVCAFPDWSPNHYLDVAEMCAGVAIGYDWCYDYFTPAQREIIKQAIYEKGFLTALAAYRRTIPKSAPSTRGNWMYFNTNWNVVCNGGIAMAALAIGDEKGYEAAAGECLQYGLSSLELMLRDFAPDGAWAEGVGYWSYTVEYLAYYIASLDSALGTDYGCFDVPGVRETAYFPMYMWGPVKTFSIGDSGADRYDVPQWSLFASKLRDPGIMALREEQMTHGGGGFKDILWYDPTVGSEANDLSLDKFFGGMVELATMRSSWNDTNALFTGMRGGDANVNHGHMDLGSFTLDANGVGWAVDPGGDDYNLPGYFDSLDNRWKLYRLKGESHNLLTINPDQTPEMDPLSRAEMKLHSKAKGAYVEIDLAKAYAKKGVQSYRRAMGLIENRSRFLVQDEVQMDHLSEIYWFMHTNAPEINLSADGKTAVLEQNGQRLHAQILSPAQAKFTVRPDAPLPTTPKIPNQTFFPDMKKLTIHLEGVEQETISVCLTPLKQGEAEPKEFPKVQPIADWEIPDGEIPALDSILMDGEPIEDFRQKKYNYIFEYEKAQETAPEISVKSAYPVKILQAATVPGVAIIEVLSQDSEKVVSKYYINFNLAPNIGVPEGKVKQKVASVDASAVPEAINTPQNTIDNDVNTKWAAQGNQWISYDLGTVKQVDSVAVYWLNGDQRISPLQLQVSMDGKEWKTVYDGISSGKVKGFETYSFTPVNTRFVRILCFGNNMTTWNSIMEVSILNEKAGDTHAE